MRTVSHHTATTYSRATAYILSHDKGVCIWGRTKSDLKLYIIFSYNTQCLLRNKKNPPQDYFLTKLSKVTDVGEREES